MEKDHWKVIVSCFLILLLQAPTFPQDNTHSFTVTINTRRSQVLNRFLPANALGAGIDGHEQGDAALELTPENIQMMKSAGLKSLTYRLRSELAGDAWHWNPQGSWSDTANSQGYWTSAATSYVPINTSYGYKLPRRGNTIDQANNDGYSRLDDGDLQTFWKSNPYLDRQFTGEANTLHPQWVVIDFGSARIISSLKLVWGTPFATRYEIQYGNFEDPSDLSFNPPGMWRTFPRGRINNGQGGEIQLSLVTTPVKARFVRILMTESSGQAPAGSRDLRDGLGYSIREVFAGTKRSGLFVDQIHHSEDHDKQTVIYVSSTDPWHRQIDLDEGVEQPGFDFVFQSGLNNNLPVMVPTELLYGTPENAANEIQYLKTKSYPVERVELGEEPDGQFVTPEDYGALYIQFVDRLKLLDPKLQFGGPSFQEILPDERRQRLGNSAFLERFLHYLGKRGNSNDYSFFSFEWYPFDDVCDPVAPQLASASGMMADALREMVRRGLSRKIPWIISEYGYSAFASRAEIGIEGALLNADIVGRFLSLGGEQAFLYGYTPGQVAKEMDCTAGNNMLFAMDASGRITMRFATYSAARLLSEEWLVPNGSWHVMYATRLRPRSSHADKVLSAYGVYRSDGIWSLLLVNKDPRAQFRIRVHWLGERSRVVSQFARPVEVFQFSSRNYELGGEKDRPFVAKNDPPEHILVSSSHAVFVLPPYSISVIRGMGPKPQGAEQ